MPPVLRLATEQDAPSIHSIYAPLVLETAVTFAHVPPAVEDVRLRIGRTLERWPWLVCEEEDVLLGYAAAGPDRANRYQVPTAYDWSVEVSVYVLPSAQRRGVAQALYTSLFAMLRRQGFVNVYASITLPNPASIALHESMGFEPVGVFRGEGFKHGKWHDVGWWQLQLRPRFSEPERPLSLKALQVAAGWKDALAAGLPMLRG